jgi:hypothetical protein
MSTFNPGLKESTSRQDPIAKVGASFGKALLLVVSVKAAEFVVEQAAHGVKALWIWFSTDKKSDGKGRPQKKARPEPQEQAA